MLIATTPVHDNLWNAANTAAYNVYVLEGGSRSSKTHSIIQFWIKWAFGNRGKARRVIITRKRLTWLTGTVVKDFMDILKAYGLYDKRNHNKSTGAGVYTLYDTEFWFMGLDDPQRIHGMSSDAFWINEAVEASFDDYAQLMQRCKGFAILDYNPSYEEHWIFDKLLKRGRTYYSHSTMLQNPFIAKNAKEQILSYEPTEANYAAGTADKRKWMIYGLGQRASLEGVIFENWDIVHEIPAWALAKHHRYGLDFGYTNDVTAIANVAWSGNELWLDEVCYQTHMVNPDIGKMIIANELRTVKGYADCSEPKSIEEIHRMGINLHPVLKPKGSVVGGIDILKRFKIHITERSLNAIREFKNYTWMQDKSGKWLNEPIDDFNHFIDASRYVAFMELGQKRENNKPLSKAALGFY